MILDLRTARRFAAPFILGALIGMSISTLRLGRQVDSLVYDNAKLMDEVERLSSKTARLEESLGEKSLRPVKAVEIKVKMVATAAEPRHQLVIEQRLNEVLAPLVGQEVDEVVPDLIKQTVLREVKVDEDVYAITPDDWIVISDVIRIHVNAISLTSSRNVAPF